MRIVPPTPKCPRMVLLKVVIPSSAHLCPLELLDDGCLKAALDEVVCPHMRRQTANADSASAPEDVPQRIIKLLAASYVAGSCCDGAQGNVTCCLRLQGSSNLGRMLHAQVTNAKEEQCQA